MVHKKREKNPWSIFDLINNRNKRGVHDMYGRCLRE